MGKIPTLGCPSEGEPIHETWIMFKELLQGCSTHGLPSDVLLQYFYRSLDSINKVIAN